MSETRGRSGKSTLSVSKRHELSNHIHDRHNIDQKVEPIPLHIRIAWTNIRSFRCSRFNRRVEAASKDFDDGLYPESDCEHHRTNFADLTNEAAASEQKAASQTIWLSYTDHKMYYIVCDTTMH